MFRIYTVENQIIWFLISFGLAILFPASWPNYVFLTFLGFSHGLSEDWKPWNHALFTTKAKPWVIFLLNQTICHSFWRRKLHKVQKLKNVKGFPEKKFSRTETSFSNFKNYRKKCKIVKFSSFQLFKWEHKKKLHTIEYLEIDQKTFFRVIKFFAFWNK